MELDEAIKHCEEVAGELQERADSAELIDILDGLDVESCKECASDHRQLAAWLRELKEYREDDWKKVEQDLPKAWYQVLVYRANGIIEMAMYTGKLWVSITQKPIKDVAYWKYTKEPKGERLDDMLELIGGAEDVD